MLKDTLINLIDLGLILISGAAYLLILTQFLPPEELALYYLYTSLFNIFGVIVTSPLTAQFDKVLDSKERAKHAYGAIILLSLIESIIIWVYLNGRGHIALFLFTIIINLVNNANLIKFFNIEKNRMLYSSFPYVSKVITTLIFIYLGFRTFEDVLLATVIPYLGVLYIGIREYGLEINISDIFSYLKHIWKTLDIKHTGGALFWVKVISVIRNYLDNILFNRPDISAIEKVRYNTASYVYKLFSESLASMVGVGFLKYEKEGKLLLTHILTSLAISFVIMLAYVSMAILIDVYFPQVFKYNIVEYLIILGIGYFLWNLGVVIRNALFALRKPKEIVFVEMLTVLIFIPLAIGKDPLKVAYALTISLSVGFLAYVVLFIKTLKSLNRI